MPFNLLQHLSRECDKHWLPDGNAGVPGSLLLFSSWPFNVQCPLFMEAQRGLEEPGPFLEALAGNRLWGAFSWARKPSKASDSKSGRLRNNSSFSWTSHTLNDLMNLVNWVWFYSPWQMILTKAILISMRDSASLWKVQWSTWWSGLLLNVPQLDKAHLA